MDPIDKPDDTTRYPGGKGNFFQRVINLMPPHDLYIETHVGGGAVIRNKKPAARNLAIDIDPAVRDVWRGSLGKKHPHVKFVYADCLKRLGYVPHLSSIVIYCDPPYLMETRKSGKIYNYECGTEHHVQLLLALKSMWPCKIIISGYHSELYESLLADWSHLSFQAMTRGGMATEHLWFNYPPPVELHEYTHLGKTYRDRERIKRKRNRWLKNLGRMPVLERNAMLRAICRKFIG